MLMCIYGTVDAALLAYALGQVLRSLCVYYFHLITPLHIRTAALNFLLHNVLDSHMTR